MKTVGRAAISIAAIGALVAVTLFSGDLYAQRGPGKGMGKGMGGCMGMGYGGCGIMHLEFMQKELGLSDEQVKKIFDLGTEYRQKCFDNRKDPEKLKSLREEHMKAVDEVFTKEQKEKRDKLGRMGKRCGMGMGPGKGMGKGRGMAPGKGKRMGPDVDE